MSHAARADWLRERDNAFGAVRLLLASLVIAAHTPELIDGNPERELLYRVFNQFSLGALAVNGFFLVSGLHHPV